MKRFLFLISLGLCLSSTLYAQQILGKMALKDISESQEMRTTIIRNPERALLIVTSQIPDLSFETNNQIYSTEQRSPGTWHIVLAPGTHRITIRAKGFVAVAKRIFFKPKEVKAYRADILGSSDRSTGSEALSELNLKMVPEDALVYINNELVDLSVQQNRRLPAATYRIRVQKKGHEAYENLIRLNPGETKSLYVVLQRSKSVAKDPAEPVVLEETQQGNGKKVWLFVAGGGAVVAGAAAYFLLANPADGGGEPGDTTPGIPDPVFPGSN